MFLLMATITAKIVTTPPDTACAAPGKIVASGFMTARACGGPEDPLVVVTRDNISTFVTGRWSGLTVDAGTLQLAAGPVPEDGELFRIKARQAYTARLTTDFQGRGVGGASLKPGDLVYGLGMRQSITVQRGGRPGVEDPMSGWIYLYCAPVKLSAKAAEIDRAMCFVEAREKSDFSLFPGVKMDMSKQYSLVLSSKGQSAHAPTVMEMGATMGIRKPKVEPASGVYPDPFDLVVTWSMRDGRRVLSAKAVDTAGASTITDLTVPGDGASTVFGGGALVLEPSAGGLTPRFETPVIDGAIVGFQPDRTVK